VSLVEREHGVVKRVLRPSRGGEGRPRRFPGGPRSNFPAPRALHIPGGELLFERGIRELDLEQWIRSSGGKDGPFYSSVSG